ncbi:MAG: DUF494 domain-containing protein, partial [Gammaproteobacteria bacterium]|nr:DUF494 domain-containing protein [Gammaproteobacteria bacterium]MCW8928510.1 DUF494 domain-containing protein [Gammaproteobacteria bacterium]
MKQDVFDILLYLFENYMYDEGELEHDRDTLQLELQDAGFRNNEISKAFDWLEGLSHMNYDGVLPVAGGQPSFRIYSDAETTKLDSECRGFVLFLEQMGVLDHATREVVIDRVMALESDEVDLDQLKWV